MNDMTQPRAAFTHMKDGTGEDWQIIAKSFGDFSKGLSDRIITHLRLLEGGLGHGDALLAGARIEQVGGDHAFQGPVGPDPPPPHATKPDRHHPGRQRGR